MRASAGHHVSIYPDTGPTTVTSVAWSPHSKSITYGTGIGTVEVWNDVTHTHMITYSGHSDVVCDVAWSPHGSLIASASKDQTVQVWKA
jgi:WD40 repeat protein